jgi:uncharacterized protein YkwD
MAFERLRAHGAVVGTVAVIAVAGLSVVSLVGAEGRFEQFDRDGGAGAGTTASHSTPPATDPVPSTATPTTTAVPGPPSGLLAELFALMNADRAAHGVGPLTWDDRLGAAAQQATDAMAVSGLVAPQDLDALLALGFARAAQTTLTGPYDVTATSAEYGWMGSTQPRATLLDPALRVVGIGATSSPDGRIWIAADFGAPA